MLLILDASGAMELIVFGDDGICDVRAPDGGSRIDLGAFVVKLFGGNEICKLRTLKVVDGLILWNP